MKLSAGKNIRLFKSPFLERFSYVHPVAPILLWGPIVCFFFAEGILAEELTFFTAITFAFSGFLVWTLSEYLLHRYVFHFKPTGRLGKRLVYLFHRIHHDDPEDQRRLLMPPVAAIALALPFYFFFVLMLGEKLGHPFFAGFLTGYLIYDYIHFATHYSLTKSGILAYLKHNHMMHHYVTPERRFGVSSTIWDYVFNTRGDQHKSNRATLTPH